MRAGGRCIPQRTQPDRPRGGRRGHSPRTRPRRHRGGPQGCSVGKEPVPLQRLPRESARQRVRPRGRLAPSPARLPGHLPPLPRTGRGSRGWAVPVPLHRPDGSMASGSGSTHPRLAPKGVSPATGGLEAGRIVRGQRRTVHRQPQDSGPWCTNSVDNGSPQRRQTSTLRPSYNPPAHSAPGPPGGVRPPRRPPLASWSRVPFRLRRTVGPAAPGPAALPIRKGREPLRLWTCLLL